jgi:hypothetical protein
MHTAAKKLHFGAAIHIGRNDWYMATGSTTGVIQVRHGIVEEIGIADAKLTRDRRAQVAFITSTHFF